MICYLMFGSLRNRVWSDDYIQNILKLKTQELMNNLDTNAITRVIQQLYDQAENDDDDETLGYCLDMWDELLASNHSFIRNVTNNLDIGLLT